MLLTAGAALGEEPVLKLHATVASGAGGGLTVTLFRWSSDAERAPVLAALAAPAAPPAPPSDAAGRAAGRGGRAGGRGAPATPPQSPAVRLSAAIKAAPTLGYIWGDGVTGYSIKYAWHAVASGRSEDRPLHSGDRLLPTDRIVLITDRRLGAHAPEWRLGSGSSPDAEYTLIEMRLDARGMGDGKTSLASSVALDAAAQTPALGDYAATPAQLRIHK